MFDAEDIPIDAELQQVIVRLVGSARGVPRPRRVFHVADLDGYHGLLVMLPSGEQEEIAHADIQTLTQGLYIQIPPGGPWPPTQFTLTERAAQLAEQVRPVGFSSENDRVRSYLIDEGFRARHPEAFACWKNAGSLVADDPIRHATRIGHDCREAMQHFATSMLAQSAATCESPVDKTVDRMRAVLTATRSHRSKGVSDFLDALIAYWGEVSDLSQRQEHGAQKEGQRLQALDGERLLFHTAVVMYEIDLTVLQEPRD